MFYKTAHSLCRELEVTGLIHLIMASGRNYASRENELQKKKKKKKNLHLVQPHQAVSVANICNRHVETPATSARAANRPRKMPRRASSALMHAA